MVVRSFIPTISADLSESVISESLTEAGELALEVARHDVVDEVWAIMDDKCLTMGGP